MKRFLTLIVSIGMLLSLTGCVILEEKEDSTQQKEQLQETQKQPPKDTVPQETKPEETQPEETEYPVPPELRPEETEPPFTPYTEKINWADQPIYGGPGYAYDFVQTVGKAGSYTIIEEAYDDQGHLWGRLKSGVGWVNLTNSRYADGHRGENEQILTAGFVDSTDQGDIFLLHDSSAYSVRIGITAHKMLTFQFCTTEITDAGYDFKEVLSSGSLQTGQMFVAQVSFPGDLSAYGLIVTDAQSNTFQYLLYTSGMDGSLVCQLNEPQA